MPASVWDQVLSRIETKVNRHSFYTWFKPTSFVSDGGDTITVRVPNPLFKDWLTKHYSGVLTEALADVRRSDTKLSFVAEGMPVVETPPPVIPPPESVPVEPEIASPGGLNPRYTFDTFIVGASNQFAHAACRAVAEAPSRSYNPLFIYGGVGLGKTHLMHAIGHYVLRHDSGLRLTYISSERFMNEMINAVRYDRVIDFRERYRSVDVLLVDDIQFLAGKEGTQTEFFHTFNALYDSQKQIVLSSDCPPAEIPKLEERLVSRFQWGLVADVAKPTFETRVAIVRAKAKLRGQELPEEVINFIAERFESNARELEGAINTLQAHSQTKERPINIELAREVIGGNQFDTRTAQVTLQTIIEAVTRHYDVKLSDLQSKRRQKSIAEPRQVCMWLARKRTRFSLQEIGGYFGGRDHTTVMHSIRTVDDRIAIDPTYAHAVNRMEEFISRAQQAQPAA